MDTNTQTTFTTSNLSHTEIVFSIGNTVRAHEGAVDMRVGVSLEGWYGTIISLYENEQGEGYATVRWSPATLSALPDSILYQYAIHNLSPSKADVLLADLRLAPLDATRTVADIDHDAVYRNIAARLKCLQIRHKQLLRLRRIFGVVIGALGLLMAATFGARLVGVENAFLLQLCDSLCAWNVVSSPLGENVFKIPIKPALLASVPQATLGAFLLTALTSLRLLRRPGVLPLVFLLGFSVVQINLAEGWIAPVLCIIIPFTLCEFYVFRPRDLQSSSSTQLALGIMVMIVVGLLSAPTVVSAEVSAFAQTSSKNNSAERDTQKQEQYWVAGVCGGCKKEIETAVKGVKGVTKAEWDLKTKIVTIDYNAAQTSPEVLKKALVATGRKVKSPKS